MESNLPQDVADLIGEFAAADVRYLLVGGYALAAHGHPRFTKDIDIWVEASERNVTATAAALDAWGAPGAIRRAFEEATGLDVVWIGNPPIRIDLLKNVPGGDFERAWDSRVSKTWGETRVNVVAVGELVALKRASGRPQDMLDVATLTGSA